MALDDAVDSDEDGEPDKEELSHCGNPSGEDLGIGPEYGCDGAHLVPHADEQIGPLFGAAATALGALVLARRKRTRRTP